MGKKVLLALPVLMFLLFLSAGPAAAIEGGLHQYPDGVDDFMMGALPPPGAYFINYAVFANISDYKDLRFSSGTRLRHVADAPKVQGWTMIDALRLIYVSKCKLLGGDFTLHVIQPIQHVEFTKAEWIAGLVKLTDNERVTMKTGLKNTTVGAAVGWHFSKNLHVAAVMDLIMPTGEYSVDDMANTGNPYWTFTPMLIGTYITDGGFEVGAKLMYDINTKNKESGYLSGQEFHADYIVGQHMGPWMFGINGYYIHQITKDKISDREPEDANFSGALTRAFSVGPAVAYNYKNMFFKAKAQWDLYSINRPQTQRYWFNFIYCF
jgi:hypothetical protein